MDSDNDRFPLHTAAREGNVVKAEGLLRTDAKLSTKKDDDGRHAIHWAASSNHVEIVTLLANQKTFDPDVQDGSGWTPLMISASLPDSEPVLHVLLQKGANVNEKNFNGQTALHFVASKKNIDTARFLLGMPPPASASTRVRDHRGQYPIHRAAAAGSVPMTTLLLDHRSPLNPTDNEGYTPLHHAIAEGHGDVAMALLKRGADFSIKNAQEELALDLAPDKEVRLYIVRAAEREGIELA
ncbi:hypothetical protein E4U42_003269 [Claviceps africana]|uniref:Uncharacterized protein n=1 Tax=Claviceps africana TaxID=83212 RepID=A0A8K0JD43_9HYPO|nr:hypothetical protein E4U42_003269 [Claviceps africana]